MAGIVIIHYTLSVLVILTMAISLSYIYRNYQSLSVPLRWFGFFLLANFVTEFGSFVLGRMGTNTLFLLHVYVPLKLACLGGFFLPLLQFRGRDFRPAGKLVVAILIIGSIFNSAFLQPLSAFNSNAYSAMTITLIGFGVIGFFRLMEVGHPVRGITPKENGLFPDADRYFRFLRQILPFFFIYECVTLFMFMFGNYLAEIDISVQRHIWIANAVLNLAFHIAVFLAVRKYVLTDRNAHTWK